MKKNNIISRVVSLLVFATSFASCDNDEVLLSPFEQQLVAYQWKFSSLVYAPRETSSPDTLMVNMMNTMNTVMQGHRLVFYKDHTYISSFDPNFKGTWVLSSDGKKLTVTDGDLDGMFSVEQLDGDDLILKSYDEVFDGDFGMFYRAVK